MTRRHASTRLLLAGTCLALTAGCSVPGGYTVKTLKEDPAASWTYPDSRDVTTARTDGTTKNFFRRGTPASVSVTATTTAPPTDVATYYSRTLTAAGWTQTSDDPHDTNVAGRTMHDIWWTKAKLTYGLTVWADPTTNTTHYVTTLTGVI